MHSKLLLLHGNRPGYKCKQCAHFSIHQMENKWFKCDLTAPSGIAGDWRANWVACGAFKEREECQNTKSPAGSELEEFKKAMSKRLRSSTLMANLSESNVHSRSSDSFSGR
jgi:hypothetical protein